MFLSALGIGCGLVRGLIAFSYGLTKSEPSLCNQKLARVVAKIIESERGQLRVVAQWEIALALEDIGFHVSHVVWPKPDSYLCSSDIITPAIPIFRQETITQVIPVAQPFLQYPAVVRQIKNEGFEVFKREIPKIGHNPDSLQPWTRSAPALVRYALRQRLTGHQGALIVTEQIKRLLAGTSN